MTNEFSFERKYKKVPPGQQERQFWLAMRTISGEPGNAPEVTGASRRTVLGALHRAR